MSLMVMPCHRSIQQNTCRWKLWKILRSICNPVHIRYAAATPIPPSTEEKNILARASIDKMIDLEDGTFCSRSFANLKWARYATFKDN